MGRDVVSAVRIWGGAGIFCIMSMVHASNPLLHCSPAGKANRWHAYSKTYDTRFTQILKNSVVEDETSKRTIIIFAFSLYGLRINAKHKY